MKPPLLALGTRSHRVLALQQSYCWGNACVDMVTPGPAQIPTVPAGQPLLATYPRIGQWDIRTGDLRYRCTYPVLVEPRNARTLALTPSGPGGTTYGSYSYRPRLGGDTSGLWRWRTPARDGRPLSWVHLVRNSPDSGGEAQVTVIVDDTAVMGGVRAQVTVRSSDRHTTRIPLTATDRGCHDRRFIQLSSPVGSHQRALDDLGTAPYDYSVRLTMHGTTYVGSGTWSGTGTLDGGDARLTFTPPLPG